MFGEALIINFNPNNSLDYYKKDMFKIPLWLISAYANFYFVLKICDDIVKSYYKV